MEETNKKLNESLDKIHSLMNFKPGMTRTENQDLLSESKLDEQGMAGPPMSMMQNRGTPKPPSQKKLDRQDRNAEFDANREMGMSKKEARGIRRDDRKADRQARRNPETPEIEGSQREYKHIDRFVRRVHKNAEDLDQDYKKLSNATYKGQNALEAAKALYKQKYNEELPMWRDYLGSQTPQPEAKPAYTPKYPLCKGGINKVGCRSNAVAQVQALVGGLDDKIKIDGMFGPRTKAAIEQVAPEFAEQFTDADVATIKAKLQAKPEVAQPEVKREPAPAKINTTNWPRPQVKLPEPETLGNVLKKREAAEQVGPTNMAIGFVNESMSQKERARKNKQDRLNKKFGRV